MISKNFIFILLLILLLLPSQIIMLKGYKSLDGRIHAERISEFHQAIKNGQFPPRLAPSLINEIGYPLFIVNYQLPYYFAEIFMIFKDDPMFSYKAVMSTTYLLSGIFAFLLFRHIGSNWAALGGAIVYSYLPYRFGNLYMRGAFGESVVLMFVPIIFLALHKVVKNKSQGLILLAISTVGLITSHTPTFLLFLPTFVLYPFLILKLNRRTLFLTFFGFFGGILLSSFQLIPSLFEKKYMFFDQALRNQYEGLFIDWHQLFRIPRTGINESTYLQVGIVATLIITISLIIFLLKRDKYILFFLAFAVFSIFLTQPASRWLWQNILSNSYILYPYRFLSMTILASAFLGVHLVDRTKFKPIVATSLILVTLYTNRHFFYSVAPWFEIKPTPTLTTQNEYDTIWSNEETLKVRPLVTSEPSSQITDIKNHPFKVSFESQVDQPTNFIIRRLYFPGWKVKVNDKDQPVDIKNGLVSTHLEPGYWKVNTFFTESPLRKFSNLLSLFSFLALIIVFFKFYTPRCK